MNNVRLKVLFFASWYPNRLNPILGGFVQKKARAIASLDDVSVIYVTKDPSAKDTLVLDSSVEDDIRVVRVYFRTSPNHILDMLLYNIRYLQACYRAWRRLKHEWGIPDLIHVQVVDRAGLPAMILKWLRGIPYVITEHSTPDVAYIKGERNSPQFPRALFKRLVWSSSEGGSVDSAASLTFLRAMGIKKDLRVIPNVVEIDAKWLSTSLTISTGLKKKALHISILIERKNVRDIILASAEISAVRTDFEIHIVGSGEQERQLINLAKEQGVFESVVFFHGRVDESKKVELIAGSDFHVLNSDEEGFSVVAAESLCYGIPVLATDCGGPEDFVTKDNGIIIKRRDREGLISGITWMLDHAREFDRSKISREARAQFASAVVAQKTSEMYLSAKKKWPSGNTATQVDIPQDAVVLDIGSGHQPHRRANILLERYPEETIHRTTQQIVVPREKMFVIGDGLAMPFRDKTFGFVVASHIAEHVDDPEMFFREMSRVGQSGYIETPGPLTEILMPTLSHKWIVTRHGPMIHFRPNTVDKSKLPGFFRFFYLNRDGYVESTWKSNSRFLVTANMILLKLWPHIPYAYTRIVWKDKVEAKVISK